MYYVRYFFKCCIRNIARLVCKPKILLVLLISLLILFFINNYSHASYLGDDTYTDPNDNIINAYKTINIDFVNRMQNTSNKNLVDNLKNYIKTGSSYYVYYGQSNGISMLNGSPLDYRNLYVLIYNKNSTYSSTAIYDNYQGLNCTVKMYNKPSGISLDSLYLFNGNTLSYLNLEDVYIPQNLLNYFDEYVIDYINDNSSTQNQEIINQLEEQKNIQEEQKNFITNTTVEDSTMNVDTSDIQVEDDTNIDTFFTDFFTDLDNVFRSIDYNVVSTISFPIPFSDKDLVLQSDLISRHIINTPLYSLIQLVYWFTFSKYIIMFSWRILSWVQSGGFENGGISDFIWYLDTENVIIKSFMM